MKFPQPYIHSSLLWKIVAPLLLLFLLVLFFLVRADGGEEEALRERGLQIRQIDDPEGSVVSEVVVAPEAVPSSMRERYSAPALALLPNKTGYPEMKKTISSPGIGEIRRAAEKFLREWETYKPGDTSYDLRISKMISPERKSAIISRVDAVDPPGVCPEASCKTGSRWFEQDFQRSSFLIDLTPEEAYLVAYGAVVYGNEGAQESSASRSYGLLFRKGSEGEWLLERVAAESLK